MGAPFRIEDVEAAYKKAAQLVENFGEEFLPAFLRAEKLMEEARMNQSAAERARRIARGLHS